MNVLSTDKTCTSIIKIRQRQGRISVCTATIRTIATAVKRRLPNAQSLFLPATLLLSNIADIESDVTAAFAKLEPWRAGWIQACQRKFDSNLKRTHTDVKRQPNLRLTSLPSLGS
jgi:hypothetical protein